MLRITGDRAAPVAATVALDGGRLVVQVGDVEVGSWPVCDVRVMESRTGVDMTIGEDTFTLDLSDPEILVSSVRAAARPDDPQRSRRRFRRVSPGPTTDPAPDRPQRSARRRLSIPVAAGLVVPAALAVATLLWPLVVGPIGLLVGLILVTMGYFAHTEPAVALRVPGGLSATFLMVTGVGVVAIGAAVTLLG